MKNFNWRTLLFTLIVGTIAFMAGKQYAPTNINMEALFSIESDNNPNAVSIKGARGLGQIMPKTWEECAKKMGKDWIFEQDWNDPEKNVAVSNYYMNVEIPRLLKHYGVPDSVDARLAAYNCGPYRVSQEYQKHGRRWKEGLPGETQRYIQKYYSRL